MSNMQLCGVLAHVVGPSFVYAVTRCNILSVAGVQVHVFSSLSAVLEVKKISFME